MAADCQPINGAGVQSSTIAKSRPRGFSAACDADPLVCPLISRVHSHFAPIWAL
jgi:hypothetical protein